MLEIRLEHIIFLVTTLMVFFLIGIVIFVVMHQKRIILLDHMKMSLEKDYELKLSEVLIKSQENERKNIGEDLHDEIAPLLASARMYLKTQIKNNGSNPDGYIHQAIDIIDDSITKIRNVSHLLHPAVLQTFGLMSALSDFCHTLKKTNGLNCEYKSRLTELNLDSFRQLMLFRIIQELVFNAEQHGNARLIKLDITKEQESLVFSIQHNGKRFTQEDYHNALHKHGSLGLKNMQHRLNLLGGTIDYMSKGISNEQHILLKIPVTINISKVSAR